MVDFTPVFRWQEYEGGYVGNYSMLLLLVSGWFTMGHWRTNSDVRESRDISEAWFCSPLHLIWALTAACIRHSPIYGTMPGIVLVNTVYV